MVLCLSLNALGFDGLDTAMGFFGVTSIGGASASKALHTRKTVDIQYAVYPFRPRSDKGRSGVPGERFVGRVEGFLVK